MSQETRKNSLDPFQTLYTHIKAERISRGFKFMKRFVVWRLKRDVVALRRNSIEEKQ
jgi:hypothetical protein